MATLSKAVKEPTAQLSTLRLYFKLSKLPMKFSVDITQIAGMWANKISQTECPALVSQKQ